MRLKLTVRYPEGVRDIAVTIDATSTVRDLTTAINSRNGNLAGSEHLAGLRVTSPGGHSSFNLAPSELIHHTDLKSGCTIEPVPTGLAETAIRNESSTQPRSWIGQGEQISRQTTDRVRLSQRASERYQIIRVPRVVEKFPDTEIAAPQLPEPPQPNRLSWPAIIAPILLGLTMFTLTQQLISLTMIALSPLIILANWYERRKHNKRTHTVDLNRFDEDLNELRNEFQTANTAERRALERDRKSVV